MKVQFREYQQHYVMFQIRTNVSDFSVLISIIIMVSIDALIGIPTPKLTVPEEFKVRVTLYRTVTSQRSPVELLYSVHSVNVSLPSLSAASLVKLSCIIVTHLTVSVCLNCTHNCLVHTSSSPPKMRVVSAFG